MTTPLQNGPIVSIVRLSENETSVTWRISCRYGNHIYWTDYISKKYHADYMSSIVSLMINGVQIHQDTGNLNILSQSGISIVQVEGEYTECVRRLIDHDSKDPKSD